MADFNFEVETVVAELGQVSAKGWGKSLTVTSFGDNEPKLDIRSWNEDYSRMGKGISLSDKEASDLFFALGEYLITNGTLDLDEVEGLKSHFNGEVPMSTEEMLQEIAEQEGI